MNTSTHTHTHTWTVFEWIVGEEFANVIVISVLLKNKRNKLNAVAHKLQRQPCLNYFLNFELIEPSLSPSLSLEQAYYTHLSHSENPTQTSKQPVQVSEQAHKFNAKQQQQQQQPANHTKIV